MMYEKGIRVLIADDHALVREGIVGLLNDEPGIYIVGQADDGCQMIDKYFALQPDLIISDISMPKLSGIEALKEIMKKEKKVKVLFLSMYEGEDYIYSCLKAGGRGLINKNILKGELVFAINVICHNKMYFGVGWDEESLEDLVIKYDAKLEKKNYSELEHLTKKQQEVLLYINKGLTSQEIGDELGISKKTVDHHRAAIMQKMNIKSLPALIKFAIHFAKDYNSKTRL